MAAAVFGHAEGQLERGNWLSLPSSTALRASASAASSRALSWSGRRQQTWPMRSAVSEIECALGELEGSSAGVGEFLVLPEPRLEGGELQARLVSSGLAADTVTRCTRASCVRPAAISRSAAAALPGLPLGRREEVEVEPGREVVLGVPRRLVAFPVAPQVRLRVKPAIGQLLLVRLQRDQFDAVACRAGDPPAVRADLGRPRCWSGSARPSIPCPSARPTPSPSRP